MDDKEYQRIWKKSKRIFAALDKGERSPRILAQLAELRKELDALMINDIPPFLNKGWSKKSS